MAQLLRPRIVFVSLLTATFSVCSQPAVAQIIWSGLTKSFSKASLADPNLPENQDPLTPNVVLTRGNAGGMINIAAESFFTPSSSPALTLWATDLNNPGKTIAATNWAELAFTNWINAYGGQHTTGSNIEGRNAVVRLTADNIYLDLQFTLWTAGGGGGYSYLRAEPSGDYNHNGFVDAADYVIWRRTSGQTGIQASSGADGNSNGQIDAGDYTYWRERFGNPVIGAGLGQTANVPEPGSAVGLICGFAMCLASRKKRLLAANRHS